VLAECHLRSEEEANGVRPRQAKPESDTYYLGLAREGRGHFLVVIPYPDFGHKSAMPVPLIDHAKKVAKIELLDRKAEFVSTSVDTRCLQMWTRRELLEQSEKRCAMLQGKAGESF
jgi:hypothetical protein